MTFIVLAQILFSFGCGLGDQDGLEECSTLSAKVDQINKDITWVNDNYQTATKDELQKLKSKLVENCAFAKKGAGKRCKEKSKVRLWQFLDLQGSCDESSIGRLDKIIQSK